MFLTVENTSYQLARKFVFGMQFNHLLNIGIGKLPLFRHYFPFGTMPFKYPVPVRIVYSSILFLEGSF